jgi:hypothetical protein
MVPPASQIEIIRLKAICIIAEEESQYMFSQYIDFLMETVLTSGESSSFLMIRRHCFRDRSAGVDHAKYRVRQ